MSKSMADIGMETKLSGSETLPNAAPAKSKISFLSNSTKTRSSRPDGMDSGKSKPKNAKRGKLMKSLTLPADASAPSTSDDKEKLVPRPIQILPRTSQYEKHPLLQEKSASGLSELELFLLEREKNPNPKPFPPKEITFQEATGPTNKLKLEPRGAHCERHALLKKTPSGMSELELFLQEKNKECEKKEKKTKKKLKESKSVGSAAIPPHKRLWIKKGISVEKAKSFERTACLEKTKSIDQGSNVSRARSLEEESSLRDVRLSALTTDKSHNPTGMNLDSNVTTNSNMEIDTKDIDIPIIIDTDPANSNDDKTLTGSMQDENSKCKQGRRKLLDLALSPSLEWKEDNQQFVVRVQSPVSPPEEKPANLLICVEHREGKRSECQVPVAAQEKPKKYVHPSVIDSDPDSEGMVCMDELEPIDFGMSSPEPSPAKTQGENQSEKEPLIINELIKSESEEAQETLQRVIPVDVEAIQERRRQLSIKRASLGQLEPRVDQYEQHILLQKRDEEGKTQIDRFLEEKILEKERLEQERLLSVESNDAFSDPNKEIDGPMKPKASIKRVHFEKSGAGQEIEELGKVDIEADPASNNSLNAGKKKGSKNKSNKGREGEPEEEKLLNGDSDDREKDQTPVGIREKNKCCCIS